MLPPHPFLIALQFLTALPIHTTNAPDSKTIGRSLLYYPLVGLLLGLILALIGWTMTGAPHLIAAAVLLSAWVLLTGMLHLDGLADSADAWIGGLGNRERTLALMKDPTCGPAAVVILVLTLLLKFTALAHLVETENWALLMLAPLLSRATLVMLFLTTPYVRPGGLGDALANHLPRRESIIAVSLSALVAFAVMGVATFWVIAILAITFAALRASMQRRIGGTTGDTAGAVVEISEVVVLLSTLATG